MQTKYKIGDNVLCFREIHRNSDVTKYEISIGKIDSITIKTGLIIYHLSGCCRDDAFSEDKLYLINDSDSYISKLSEIINKKKES